MDVHGEHLAEWGEVIAKVEEMARIEARKDGKSIRSFGSNSLERLAKDAVITGNHADNKITYLPSRQCGPSGIDGHLMRIRRADMKVDRQVVSGKMSILEGRKAAGLKVEKVTQLGRAKSAIVRMTDAERAELVEWMKEQGWA